MPGRDAFFNHHIESAFQVKNARNGSRKWSRFFLFLGFLDN
jgi:hypothetical protein